MKSEFLLCWTISGEYWSNSKSKKKPKGKRKEYWLTPKASEKYECYEGYLKRMKSYSDPKTSTKTKPNSLSMQVSLPKFWPKNARQEKENVKSTDLNPNWIEWLMGFPQNWTE